MISAFSAAVPPGVGGDIGEVEDAKILAIGGDGVECIVADEANVPGVKSASNEEFLEIRASRDNRTNLERFETLGERQVHQIEPEKAPADGREGFERGGEILRPAIEGGEVKGGECSAVVVEAFEQREKVGASGSRRPLVPSDEFQVRERRPVLRRVEEEAEEGGRRAAGVDGEARDGGEGEENALGEEDDGGGGGGDRVAPGGEEREIEVGNRSEGGWEKEKASEVSPEREVAAGGAV